MQFSNFRSCWEQQINKKKKNTFWWVSVDLNSYIYSGPQETDITHKKHYIVWLTTACSTCLLYQTLMSTKSVMSSVNNKFQEAQFTVRLSVCAAGYSGVKGHTDPNKLLSRIQYPEKKNTWNILHFSYPLRRAVVAVFPVVSSFLSLCVHRSLKLPAVKSSY